MSATSSDAKHPPRHPRAPGWSSRPGAPANDPVRRKRGLPWIPLLVLFFIVGTGMQMAIRALEEGDIETAAGALVIFAVVAVVALSRFLKSRKR